MVVATYQYLYFYPIAHKLPKGRINNGKGKNSFQAIAEMKLPPEKSVGSLIYLF
jgi:hypothetical protein